MNLSSPEFEDGEHMPERCGHTRENVNPELTIEGVPGDAESLVLIMDDPDAVEPAGKIWDHWIVWNIDPRTQKIESGESPGMEGMTDFRDTGYGGPNPPDGTHTYRFRLYAVDRELDLPGSSGKEDVEEEIEGHVLDEAELNGKFDPI